MADSMLCDSSYRSGAYSSQASGLYLGWMSHAQSPSNSSRLQWDADNVTLCLAGEVRVSSQQTLEAGPLKHAGLLIDLYKDRGPAFLNDLNGCFAGVLDDKQLQSCLIFNDRHGIGRLFVHVGREGIYFASEAKAILSVVPETRAFDPVGLSELLTCGCTLGGHSLFKGIEVLPAASLWTVTRRGIRARQTYFNPSSWEEQHILDGRQFAKQLADVFPRVARACSWAAEPVGLSLTGGLDSRMVIASLDTSTAFPCYTFGSMYRDTADVIAARKVAETCGQTHTVLVPGLDFLRNFSGYMEKAVFRSDGYLGFGGAAELYVNSLARNIAPIRLTGNYGSELLRGARAFKVERPESDFVSDSFRPYLTNAQTSFQDVAPTHPVSFAVYQAAQQGYGRRVIEESQVTMRTPFLDNEVVKLAYRRPMADSNGADACLAVIRSQQPELLNIHTDRGQYGTGTPVTRAVRRAYQELTFKAEYWANHRMPRWAATLGDSVAWLSAERRLLGRHKFQHFRRWLQDELFGYVKESLQSTADISSYIDVRYLQRMIDARGYGFPHYVKEIDQALTLSLTAKVLFRGRCRLTDEAFLQLPNEGSRASR